MNANQRLRSKVNHLLGKAKNLPPGDFSQIIQGIDDSPQAFRWSMEYVCDALEVAHRLTTPDPDVIRMLHRVIEFQAVTDDQIQTNGLRDDVTDCWVEILSRWDGLAPTLDCLLGGGKAEPENNPVDETLDLLAEYAHPRTGYLADIFSRWSAATNDGLHSLTVLDFLLRARTSVDRGQLFQQAVVRQAAFDQALIGRHLASAAAILIDRYGETAGSVLSKQFNS